jgi:hypothetical protein
MSAYNGATSGGFNQSGGGYYLITTAITPANVLSYTAGSGSGGATSAGSLAAYAGGEAQNWSTNCFGANKLIKDMGKTVVSAGRAFRKFQAVVAASQSTGGVTGLATTAPGYLTAYLEVTAPNGGGSGGVINTMVRYA